MALITLPAWAPVSVNYSGGTYSVVETAADYLAAYTGTTYYISPTGDDGTGTGTEGNPWETIAYALTQASALDRIELAPGVYAPTDVTKNVAIRCTTGKAFIGVFDNLQTAQIDPINPGGGTTGWNVDDVVPGATFKGFLRADEVRPSGGLLGSVRGTNGNDTVIGTAAWYGGVAGAASVFAGGTSANFFLGTAEDLPTLVAAGSILAWSDDSLTQINLTTNGCFLGEGLVFASEASDVLYLNAGAEVVMDRVEVYGGGQCLENEFDNNQLLMFDCIFAGASSDNIDHRNNCTVVESNVLSVWPGQNLADNASTGHVDSQILRVGGTYRGGSRTIHDIDACVMYSFSITVGDSITGDKSLLTISDTAVNNYDDVTFLDTFAQGDLTNFLNFDPGTAEFVQFIPPVTSTGRGINSLSISITI